MLYSSSKRQRIPTNLKEQSSESVYLAAFGSPITTARLNLTTITIIFNYCFVKMFFILSIKLTIYINKNVINRLLNNKINNIYLLQTK